MPAHIIDGNAIARKIRAELAQEIERLKSERGVTPGLATVLVGDNPASQSYILMKNKACHKLGLYSEQHTLPATISEADLLALIAKLNRSEKIHGILAQLPLPDHIDEHKIINEILPEKDVDGFHPVNMGKLLIGLPGFRPCTPFGVQKMLMHSGIDPAGKHVVVVGRSNIVGKPIAQLLLAENGTVTIAHSRTVNLIEVTKRADILVVAIGKRQMIDAEYVKPGAAVIDVGIHRDEANHLCGDVDYESVFPVASAITPVPGGVGPMTIAMLMKNCIESRRRRL